jgi:hypothetical protein
MPAGFGGRHDGNQKQPERVVDGAGGCYSLLKFQQWSGQIKKKGWPVRSAVSEQVEPTQVVDYCLRATA